MNVFRLTGDLSHLAAIIILLLKIMEKQVVCQSISGKSQILCLLLYFTTAAGSAHLFHLLYNTCMKVIYAGCSYTHNLIYMEIQRYCCSHDSFRLGSWLFPVGSRCSHQRLLFPGTVLYCDFFYLYVTKVLKGKKLSLPA
ncbi:ER lumen protein retaining receptor 2 [Lates japonicus]|uniref:ER lumen protein retaining receptor 2 n=1 Tax=Lates japonicus TaxID=270547 RepID=A0AAD3REW4_LATJO|nr:ER lumen protein retaining receptor 2 [Lates japonicus]